VSDPHRAFGAWLADGAVGEPPRDAALHASVCSDCLGQLAALDALTAIDVGRASLPPSRVGERRTQPRVTRTRLVTLGAASVSAAIVLGAGGSLLLGNQPLPAGRVPTFGGAVLAATGTPAASPATAVPSASATARESTRHSRSPRPTIAPTQAPPALRTTAASTVRPQPTQTATNSARPTSSTTAVATRSAPPSSSPAGTPGSTATPSPSATATPAASASPSASPG
jgi:hypothetical protein